MKFKCPGCPKKFPDTNAYIKKVRSSSLGITYSYIIVPELMIHLKNVNFHVKRTK